MDAAALVLAGLDEAAKAQAKVGLVPPLSGTVSSIGIPCSKGATAWFASGGDGAGQKVTLDPLDDASDRAISARIAGTPIKEDHVAIHIGQAGAPLSPARYGMATQDKVPTITTAAGFVAGAGGDWQNSIPHPARLMVVDGVEHMRTNGIKTVAYIGFDDAWGDLVYDVLVKTAEPAGIKIVVFRPHAVLTGSSGSHGALAHIALAETASHRPAHSTNAVIHAEFVHPGGGAVDGVIAPIGPMMCAEQLPDRDPVKSQAMRFCDLNDKANGTGANDPFAARGDDAFLMMADAVCRAAAGPASPGMPAFRTALHCAEVRTHELAGIQSVYTLCPGERAAQTKGRR